MDESQVPPDVAALINDLVARGVYASAEEAIVDAAEWWMRALRNGVRPLRHMTPEDAEAARAKLRSMSDEDIRRLRTKLQGPEETE